MIYIGDLPKGKLVVALYQNVFRKSEASIQQFLTLSKRCHNQGSVPEVGVFNVDEDEAQIVLHKQNHWIGNLGSVFMNIDFSGLEIDTQQYDAHHQTSDTLGVLPAADCVKLFRQTLQQEIHDIALAEEADEMRKQLVHDCGEYLREIFRNKNIELTEESQNRFNVSELPDLTDRNGAYYANYLLSLGIGVKFEKAQAHTLFTVQPQLIIIDDIRVLHEKLKIENLKPRQNWCVVM